MNIYSLADTYCFGIPDNCGFSDWQWFLPLIELPLLVSLLTTLLLAHPPLCPSGGSGGTGSRNSHSCITADTPPSLPRVSLSISLVFKTKGHWYQAVLTLWERERARQREWRADPHHCRSYISTHFTLEIFLFSFVGHDKDMLKNKKHAVMCSLALDKQETRGTDLSRSLSFTEMPKDYFLWTGIDFFCVTGGKEVSLVTLKAWQLTGIEDKH